FGPLPAAPVLVLVNVGANVEAAEVFINQKRVGVTPLKVKLKEGKYTISVRKPEFLMVEETVAVAGPGPVDWNAALKPVPKKVEKVVVVPPVTPPGKKDEKKDDAKPFYATWWFWTGVAVGVAAVTGGTIWALNSGGTEYDVGTVKFSINPSAAERDFIFYQE
ncbi:MAG: PEGA domain-containing protein, partial [Deltaproteobacteria bacterium]|nr:PEGA domain-containing protein [Deltaproteobacteria bacterium]